MTSKILAVCHVGANRVGPVDEAIAAIKNLHGIQLELRTEPPFDSYLVTGLDTDNAALAECLSKGWPDRPVIWSDGCGSLQCSASVADCTAVHEAEFAHVFPQAMSFILRLDMIGILREVERVLSLAFGQANEPALYHLRHLIMWVEQDLPVAADGTGARLAVVAPDLLDVLKAAYPFVGKLVANTNSVIGKRVLDRMTAVIDKVEPQ